jgi:tetratricopeptide (TPR) repeat protein/transcriptional regulator with XRE-family HTH domain
MTVHPLRAAREQRGWSQAQLAEHMGVSIRSIIRWERGTVQPYAYHLEQLTSLFDMSAQQLGVGQQARPAKTLPARPARPARPEPSRAPTLIDPLIPFTLGHPNLILGREALLTEIKTRLMENDSTMALTALGGLPGIGKTTLAAALTLDDQIQRHFTDGILWAALGSHPNVPAQLSRWGTLLGIKPDEIEGAQLESAWSRALHATIGKRRMLLVIDDAWSGDAALAFQVGGPNCAHLLTTRLPQVAFTFAANRTLLVPELSEAAGLSLLERSVPELVQADPQQARELVQAVGSLPLALKLIGHTLAASAATGQPRRLNQTLHMVQDAQKRLQVSMPTAFTERPQSLPEKTPLSLQATISLSDQLLSEKARQALQALAVYPPKPNSFSEEAALWIMGPPIEALDELWDTGLLENSGPQRYTLHQTIADYARLHTSPEHLAQLQQQLMGAWLPHVNEHARDYTWLDQEWNNVQTVMDTALQDAHAPGLARTISALQPYLRARGLLLQAEQYGQQGIEVAKAQEDQEGHLLLLCDMARVENALHGYTQMEALAQQGLELCQPHQVEARCDLLSMLGQARLRQAKSAEALKLWEEAMELARQLQDTPRICNILRDLGQMSRRENQFERAHNFLEEGLRLAQQQGLHEQTCALLDQQAAALWQQGQLEQAEHFVQQGLKLAQQQGYRLIQSDLLELMAIIMGTKGSPELADPWYKQALAIHEQIGNRERMSRLLGNMAANANEARNYVEGAHYAREAMKLAEQLNYPEDRLHALVVLGTAVGMQGDEPQAIASFEEALQVAHTFQNLWLTANVLYGWGAVLLHHKQTEAAGVRFQEMLTMGENQPWIGWAQWGLARVAEQRGDVAEARRLGQTCLETFVATKDGMAEGVRSWLDALPQEEEKQPQ